MQRVRLGRVDGVEREDDKRYDEWREPGMPQGEPLPAIEQRLRLAPFRVWPGELVCFLRGRALVPSANASHTSFLRIERTPIAPVFCPSFRVASASPPVSPLGSPPRLELFRRILVRTLFELFCFAKCACGETAGNGSKLRCCDIVKEWNVGLLRSSYWKDVQVI